MKIGFDAKRFYQNFTGLGNYSRFVVKALASSYSDSQFFLFSPKTNSHPEINPIAQLPNVVSVSPSGLLSALGGSVWRSWLLSFERPTSQLDIYHGLSHELPYGLSKKTKKVVTIHDLIFLRYPQFYNPIDVAIYKKKALSACNRADVIIAISSQTAGDIQTFLKVHPAKIRVVYQGCHPNFNRIVSEGERRSVLKKYDLPAEYILNVGTIEERKNVHLVVDALAKLRADERIPLVIVGRATNYIDKIRQLTGKYGLTNEVMLRHDIAFADLPAVYQSSKIFCYPSLFEGFGIPLVEAIKSGVPLITSTGSCFQEAAGPGAIYTDPFDSDKLALHLQLLLRNQKRREEIVSETQQYIQRFEPAVIARELMNVYETTVDLK